MAATSEALGLWWWETIRKQPMHEGAPAIRGGSGGMAEGMTRRGLVDMVGSQAFATRYFAHKVYAFLDDQRHLPKASKRGGLPL